MGGFREGLRSNHEFWRGRRQDVRRRATRRRECGRRVPGEAGGWWSRAGTRRRHRSDHATARRSGDPRGRSGHLTRDGRAAAHQAGGDRISVTIGDFADVPVPGTYRLIYVVFNTLFNLLTQEDQVRCFKNVAAHLTDDGSFVIEAGSPAFLYWLRHDQHVDAESIEVDTVRLDVLRHDPAKQMLDESHVSISRTGVRLNPIVQRYAWPAELDLMARIAGLRLKERWDGWTHEPFTGKHNVVSVYGR